jgi:hypothetical protein
MKDNAVELPYLEDRIDATKARLEKEAEEERIRLEKEQEEARAAAAKEEERLRAAAAEERAQIRAQEEEIARLKQAEEDEAARAAAAARELEQLRLEEVESQRKVETERVEQMKQKIAEARRLQAEKDAALKKKIEQFTGAPKAFAGGILDALGGEGKNAGIKLAGVGAVVAGALATAVASIKILQEKGDGRKELNRDELMVNESLFDDRNNGNNKPSPGPSSDYSFTRPTDTASAVNGRNPDVSSAKNSRAGSDVNGNIRPSRFSPADTGSNDPSIVSPLFSATKKDDVTDSKPRPDSFVFQKKNGSTSFSSNGISTKDKDGNMREIPPPFTNAPPDEKRQPLKPPSASSFPSPLSNGARQTDFNQLKTPSDGRKTFSPYGPASWKEKGTQPPETDDSGASTNQMNKSQAPKQNSSSQSPMSASSDFSGEPPRPAAPTTKKGSFSPFGQKPMPTASDMSLYDPPGTPPNSMSSWSSNGGADTQQDLSSSTPNASPKTGNPTFGSSLKSPSTDQSSIKQNFSSFGTLPKTSDSTPVKSFAPPGVGSFQGSQVTSPPQQESSSSTPQPRQSSNVIRPQTPSSPFGSTVKLPDTAPLEQQSSFLLRPPSKPAALADFSAKQSFEGSTTFNRSSELPSSTTSRGDDMYARLQREQQEAEMKSKSQDSEATASNEAKQQQAPKKSFSPFGGSKPKASSSGNGLYGPPSDPSEQYGGEDDVAKPSATTPQSGQDNQVTKKSFSPFGGFKPIATPEKSGEDNQEPKKSFSPFGGSKPKASFSGNSLYDPQQRSIAQTESKQEEAQRLLDVTKGAGNPFQSVNSQDGTKQKASQWSPFSPKGKESIATPLGTNSSFGQSTDSPSSSSSLPFSTGPPSKIPAQAQKRSFSPFGTGQKPQAPNQKKETIFSTSGLGTAESKSQSANEKQYMFAKLRKDAESRQTTPGANSSGFGISGSPKPAIDFKPSQRAATTSFSFSPPGTPMPKSSPKDPMITSPPANFEARQHKPFAASAIPSRGEAKSRETASGSKMDEVNRRSEEQAGLSGKYGEDMEIQKERSRLKGLEEARKRAMAAASKPETTNAVVKSTSAPPQPQQTQLGSNRSLEPNIMPPTNLPFMDQPQQQESQAQKSENQNPLANQSQSAGRPWMSSKQEITSSPLFQKQQQQLQDQPSKQSQSASSPWMSSIQQKVSTPPFQQQQQQPLQDQFANQSQSTGSPWMSSKQQTTPPPPFQQQQNQQFQKRAMSSMPPPLQAEQSPGVKMPTSQQAKGSPRPAFNGYRQDNRMNESDQDPEMARIILNADANYIPSKQALVADSSVQLMQEVDGDLSLFSNFDADSVSNTDTPTTASGKSAKETIYRANNINVHGQSFVSIPIKVSTAGSIVEYTIEKKNHDFLFGIDSRVGQGQEIVKVSHTAH